MWRTRAVWVSLAVIAASGGVVAPAHAVAPSIVSVAADGPLRAGAFSQSLRAVGSGFSAATMAVVAEVDVLSSPGSLQVTGLGISSTSVIYGQVGAATTPGTYFLNLCITPKATATCASALASRAFTVVVSSTPAALLVEPSAQSAAAGDAAPYVVKVLDAASRLTQLAASESVSVTTSESAGTATVTGVDTPATGLNARLRIAGLGTFKVSNDVAGSLTEISISSSGFVVPDATALLSTEPPPHDIAIVVDEPVAVTTLGATVGIAGVVLDGAGDPLAGAEVSGAVSGVDSGATTTQTTGPDGRFTIQFPSTSAVSGQRDSIEVTASEATHGSDSAEVTVYFTANGRTPIGSMTIDGIPAHDFTGIVAVPATGIASTRDSTAVQVQVVAAVPGATVDLETTGGVLTQEDDAPWSSGLSRLRLVADESGHVTAFLHSTRTGVATVSATAARVIDANVTAMSPPPAARDIAVSVERARISAGQRDLLAVAVTDAFGNPVGEARVDLAMTSSSPGRFAGGGRQLTVRTDADGTAEAEIVTNAAEGGQMVVIARGDIPRCDGTNQYSCPVNEPAPGFDPSSGAQRIVITVVRRSVSVVSPRRDAAVSTNGFVVVRARTTGLRTGDIAMLKMGRREIARARVTGDGTLRFAAVRAKGDGVYAVVVAGISTRVQVKVLPFGITGATRGRTLALSVATGAWARGTIVSMTRDGHVVSRSRVLRAHQPLVFNTVPRSGTYQVIVQTPLGVVPGAKPYVVR